MSGQRPGSPLEGRDGRGARANGVEANVLRMFTVNGAPWVECEHPQTLQRWKAPMLSVTSGSKVIDHAPIEGSTDPKVLGARVKLLFIDSYRAPVLLGCEAQFQLAQSTPQAEADQDRTAPPSVGDRVLLNHGGIILIGPDGEITLDTGTAEGNGLVRIQLKPGAVLRVSRNAKADGRLLLADPTIAVIAQLEAQVKALSDLVLALADSGPSGSAHVDYAKLTAPDIATAHVKAAAIHVSADAESP